jgi:putative membrane protein insertion efficiency factor
MSTRPSIAARAGMRAIHGYQVVMAGTTSRCRYAPTCSEYTREAIEIHGFGRGVWMGIKRIGRCHPWHAGGFDPVPAHGADARPDDANTLTRDPNTRSVLKGSSACSP